MGTETKYRVGVITQMSSVRQMMSGGRVIFEARTVTGVWMWFKAESDPLDLNTWEVSSDDADTFEPKVAMTWVQVLAARHECVVVERVEVAQ